MKKKRISAQKRGEIARLWASTSDPGSLAEAPRERRRYFKTPKQSLTLRLDADVLAWFKKQGPRYQTKINRTLRRVMNEGIDVSL